MVLGRTIRQEREERGGVLFCLQLAEGREKKSILCFCIREDQLAAGSGGEKAVSRRVLAYDGKPIYRIRRSGPEKNEIRPYVGGERKEGR